MISPALSALMLVVALASPARAAKAGASSPARRKSPIYDYKRFTAGWPAGWKAKTHGLGSSVPYLYVGRFWCAPSERAHEAAELDCGDMPPSGWANIRMATGWSFPGFTDREDWSAKVIESKTCKAERYTGEDSLYGGWCGKLIARKDVDGQEGHMFLDDTTSRRPGTKWPTSEPGLKSITIFGRAPRYDGVVAFYAIQYIAPAADFDRYLDDFEAFVRGVKFKRD